MPDEMTFEDVENLFVGRMREDAIEAIEAVQLAGFRQQAPRPPAIGADDPVVRATVELIGEEVVRHIRIYGGTGCQEGSETVSETASTSSSLVTP